MLLPETELSKQVCRVLDLNGFFYFHPANEGRRTPWERRAFKANGGKPGIPDLVIVLQGGKIAFVELKTANGRQSNHQKFFQEVVERRGHTYQIWRNINDALTWCLQNGGRR